MTKDRVIGKDGKMPWHIPEELKNFKRLTMGKPMIMGRTTFDSLGNKTLPGRESVVLSSQNLDMSEGCHLAKNIEDALRIASSINQDEVMVIGGAKVYEQFLPIANKILLTSVHDEYQGDTFFPEISTRDWQEISKEEFSTFTVIEMAFKK